MGDISEHLIIRMYVRNAPVHPLEMLLGLLLGLLSAYRPACRTIYSTVPIENLAITMGYRGTVE